MPPETSTPKPHAAPPPRLRPRFAALGLVGGAMVCLPLLQLLQIQSTELDWAQAHRAALDPAAEAVAVQRRLLAHRDTAGRVLRGRQEQEPERRTRQVEVDAQLTRLQHALGEAQWGPPLQETERLSQDWTLLARQVTQRQISADTSDSEHRLRVEQVLQVLDLVSLAALAPRPGGGAPPGGSTAAPLASFAHAGAALGPAWALPDVALQWARLSPDSDAAALHDAQRALQRQLQALQAAAGRDAPLAAAAARADARSRRWLAQLSEPSRAAAAGAGSAGSEPQDALRSAALQAVFDLQAAATHHSRAALEARLQEVQWQRGATLAALTALATAWGAVLIALQTQLRHLRRPTEPTDPAPTQPPRDDSCPAPRAESAPVAERLIRRLQDAESTAGPLRPPRTRPRDAQPSLPPEA